MYDISPSFLDQMTANYISHHGILGQKWGVRRYQNEDGTLTPAGRARRLNDYDDQMKALTIDAANANARYSAYSKKAAKAKIKGNLEKHDGYKMRADDEAKRIQAYQKRMMEVGEKYVAELKSLDESGLSYKVIKQEFAIPKGRNRKAATNDIVAKYGKVPWIATMRNTANRSSGNRFVVADPSKQSELKRDMWKQRHTVNTFRPQRETYYYM